jgi:hypothetical protein
MNHRPTAKLRELQEMIAAQTAAFLKSGGKIKRNEIQHGRDQKAKHGGFTINGKLGNRLKQKPKKNEVH